MWRELSLSFSPQVSSNGHHCDKVHTLAFMTVTFIFFISSAAKSASAQKRKRLSAAHSTSDNNTQLDELTPSQASDVESTEPEIPDDPDENELDAITPPQSSRNLLLRKSREIK
jgi:hypothetical protein